MTTPPPHRSKVLWNSVLTTLMFFVTVVTSLVMAPVLVRSLGAERYGLWELALGLYGYVCLLDLGVSQAIVRYVAVSTGAGDRHRLQQVFGAGFGFFLALSGIGAFLLALAAIDPSLLLNAPPGTTHELRVMLLLFALTFACNYLCAGPVCYLLGVQTHVAVNAFRIIKTVVQSIAMYWALGSLALSPLISLAAILLIAAAVELLFFLGLMHMHPGAPRHVLGAPMPLLRELLSFGAKSAALMAAATLVKGGLLLVLAHGAGVGQVVFFVFPLRLVEYAQSLGQAMGIPLTPYFADAFGRAGAAPRDAWVSSTRALQFVMFGTMLGVVWLGLPFLALWMGPQYAERGSISFGILCIGMIAQGVAINANRLLFSLGRHGTMAVAAATLGALCLAAAVPLVLAFGIEGAAVAMTVLALGQSAVELMLACRHLGIGLWAHVGATLRRYGLPLLAGSLAFHLCRDAVEPTRYADLVAIGLVGSSVYLGACLVTALSDAERRLLWFSMRARVGLS